MEVGITNEILCLIHLRIRVNYSILNVIFFVVQQFRACCPIWGVSFSLIIAGNGGKIFRAIRRDQIALLLDHCIKGANLIVFSRRCSLRPLDVTILIFNYSRLWIWVVANFQEHLLKCSDGDSVGLNIEVSKVVIEVSKEIFEESRVLLRNLNGHLALDFRKHCYIWSQSLFEIGKNLCVRLRSALDDSHNVTDTKARLQEHRRSQASHFSCSHDADSITKDVGFIHIVSRKKYDFVLFVGTEHVPELASSLDIEASRRLVKQHKSGVTAESDCN